MIDKIRRIKYKRLKPEERYLYDILSKVEEIKISKEKIKEVNDESSSSQVKYYDISLYKYNGQIIFDISKSDTIHIIDRYTIYGRDRNCNVKTQSWCSYKNFWKIFYDKFNINSYVEVQDLFNRIIGKYYNLEYPLFDMDTSDTQCERYWGRYE